MTLAPAVIAALIGAGTAGTEMGLQASGAFSPSTSGATNAAAAQQKAAEAQAFKHFAPDVQEAVGGNVSNPTFAQMAAELQGSPQDIGLAQQTIFGNTNQPGTIYNPPGGAGLASSVG